MKTSGEAGFQVFKKGSFLEPRGDIKCCLWARRSGSHDDPTRQMPCKPPLGGRNRGSGHLAIWQRAWLALVGDPGFEPRSLWF